MTKEQVLQLDCKKHIKIYLLSKLDLKNKDISSELKTNPGHVYNVLKDYKLKDEKINKAESYWFE